MDQSFGAFLLRVRSINLHATLIARHPLSFSLDVIGGNFAAGLNSGILDTKQTESRGRFHFGPPPQRLGAIKEIECDLVSTRQRRGKKGLATYGERMRGRNLVYFSRDNRVAEVLNIKFRR